MSLFNVFNIAATALTAQSLRLNAVASNLANADSAASSTGDVYKAKQVVFTATQIPGAPGYAVGVRVSDVVEDPAPPRFVYDPKHPLADTRGYVSYPNVDPVEEMVNMISASRSYQANVEMMNTARTLLSKALTIGQA
jgi:flagellar basal-body rod protein FlgC